MHTKHVTHTNILHVLLQFILCDTESSSLEQACRNGNV